MRTSDLDFGLPPELIAQEPPPRREASRLMHFNRLTGAIAHRAFAELPEILRRGDLLVFNDALVLPARFMLRKITGGRIEGLFLRETAPGHWAVLLKGLERYSQALTFEDEPGIVVQLGRSLGEGEYEVELSTHEPAEVVLGRVGRMPLPPYIRREKGRDNRDPLDRERYQTVFARSPGAVAAPTASLHFSDELLAEFDAAGIERTFVTLNIGMGTFKPVSADDLDQHVMHEESYTIPPAAAEALNRAKSAGRRIVAVGTTATRVLESQPGEGPIRAGAGSTGIFIRPPYQWKHVGALITNFHLPRSTLIALVAAFVGLETQRRLYKIAIEQRYRFFSYGDAMLVE